MYRDGVLKSIWQAEIQTHDRSKLPKEVNDVVIVGAGITGWSAAIHLQSLGLKCLVIEAENTGFGTTGGTTAHLNTFFDASYEQVIDDFGLEKAQLFAQAGKDALSIIESNIFMYELECDFESKEAFLFATDEQQEKRLEKRMEACQKLGINMVPCDKTPFPIPFVAAARVSGQAQFHPIKYINGLRDAFLKLGGEYVEKCRFESYEKRKEILEITTEKGKVHSKFLILATHTPPGTNLLHFKNLPWRSYGLSFELKEPLLPNALGYDLAEPYHYYRTQKMEGSWHLILGGNDHKTGKSKDTNECLALLEEYAHKHFDFEEPTHKWSSQLYESVDGLPFIGRMPGGPDEVFVATGYTGNGMIFGTLAGDILSELILEETCKYEELFNPRRIKPMTGISKFATHNFNAATDWIKDKLVKAALPDLNSMENNQGKLVQYEGKSYAIFKDPSGELHALKNQCTHLQCSVEWNTAELTWDCPCHGSRFGVKGNVLTAPAVHPLESVDLVEKTKGWSKKAST